MLKTIKNILTWLLLLPVYFYRLFISPLLSPSCRYQPTCSQYAIEALKTHGSFYGSYLTAKRILSCHPWGGSGFDPVPEKKSKKRNSEQIRFYDIHTHLANSQNNEDYIRIINVNAFEFEKTKELCPHAFFSCGIHPWNSENNELQMAHLVEIANDSQIVAIGEAGLDKLCGVSLEIQLPILKKQIELSENLHKPLIIHCVKAWNELIDLRRKTKPSQRWIIHGYCGKPELTKQLVSEGFLFSVGSKINALSLPLIPLDSLFCETDESEMDICEVYLQIAKTVNMDIRKFSAIIEKNVQRIFCFR